MPLCAMGILGKRMHKMGKKSGAITIPELLKHRYNDNQLALLSSALMAILLAVFLIPQFTLAGIILDQLLGSTEWFNSMALWLESEAGWLLPQDANPKYSLGLFLFAGLVIIYTTIGGFKAVVWTDMLQGVVMVAGVLIMLVLIIAQSSDIEDRGQYMAEMTTPDLLMVELEIDSPEDQDLEIPSDSWIVQIREGEDEEIIRSNEPAFIPKGSTASKPIKAVRITSQNESLRIRKSLSQLQSIEVSARIVEDRSYRSAAKTKGAYVSLPGPSTNEDGGFLPLGLAISFFAFWALSGTGQPGNLVRLLAFKNVGTLRKAIVSLSVYFTVIYLCLVVIFCFGRILVPGLDFTPDRIMPVLSIQLSETAGMPWLGGLLIAAPFAAAMSTVDSFMLMISSSFVRDYYQNTRNTNASEKGIARLSYTTTLLVGLAVTIAALYPPRFMQYIIVFAGGALSVIFIGPVTYGLFWPKFGKKGALWSMTGGLVVYVGLYLIGFLVHPSATPIRPLGLDPLIPGFIAAFAFGWLGQRRSSVSSIHSDNSSHKR